MWCLTIINCVHSIYLNYIPPAVQVHRAIRLVKKEYPPEIAGALHDCVEFRGFLEQQIVSLIPSCKHARTKSVQTNILLLYTDCI